MKINFNIIEICVNMKYALRAHSINMLHGRTMSICDKEGYNSYNALLRLINIIDIYNYLQK